MTEFEVAPDIRNAALWRFEENRGQILADVVDRTYQDVLEQTGQKPLDLPLLEALYAERQRLRRFKANVFTRERKKRDQIFWNGTQARLIRSPGEVDRRGVLRKVLEHYLEEIGGHFNPGVYSLATHALPVGFNWMLNAASAGTLNPWRQKAQLQSKLRIVGEVPMLEGLAKKGTILLVPTHQSNLDSVLIGYVIHLMNLPPFAYGAGLNLFSNPLLSFFMSRLGAYTVDRNKTNEIYKSALKHYSTRILRQGVHSIFFPGGGRSRSGAIEQKVKLGLLGTALEAQTLNLREGRPNPNVYVVPMVTSYHFVLEAASLIDDYLLEQGKHRFIAQEDESWQVRKVLGFFWKFFATESSVTVRIGKPMDVFGNLVDEDGNSLGPNGTLINPCKWLTTRGEVRPDAARDREYTRELGQKVVERFHLDNTVLSSHAVAFALFEALRKHYPDLDLYRFMRLLQPQRTLAYGEFLQEAESLHRRLIELSEAGRLHLSDELQTSDVRAWVQDGIRNLGIFHDKPVVKVEQDTIFTEDMSILYYYRNRLAGYGLSLKGDRNDRKGFLA